ncbi:MAG: hypothetical protein ACRC23_01555 [Aeromonas jandaei]
MEKQCKYVVRALQLGSDGWGTYYLYKYDGRISFTANIQQATLFDTDGEALDNLWKHNRGFRNMVKRLKAEKKLHKLYRHTKHFIRNYMKTTKHEIIKLEVLNETNK